MSKNIPMWLDRHPIVDEGHSHDLETRAAINEFHYHMPRQAAEERAYKEYLRDRHLDAAAHHLAGVKAAHASNDMESARKHGGMYQLHMKMLGLDPVGPPPGEIASRLREDPPSVYKFKPHKADLFALQPVAPEPVKGG